jgi:nickel/cobalt transporter (NiCoT) family protein
MQRGYAFSRAEWTRLAGFYGCIAALHAIGWGCIAIHASDHPTMLGLGVAAYMLGLRHAFDADHIAAIDDSVRLMLQRGDRPMGVGFFFSLGHASVVLMLAVALVVAAATVRPHMSGLQHYGAIVGTAVSGTFLWIVGLLNLVVLLHLLGVWTQVRSGRHDHASVEAILARRGFINRLLGGRVQRFVSRSWHLYPLGILFGLGFDTASEIVLLGMTAGATLGDVPVSAVLSLPILFAAGMSLMDTTDGVFMVKAYDWAFVSPTRKILYNLSTTAISVVVALLIGSVELAQLAIDLTHAEGPFADYVEGCFATLGYSIVAIFLLAWMLSVAVWKTRSS